MGSSMPSLTSHLLGSQCSDKKFLHSIRTVALFLKSWVSNHLTTFQILLANTQDINKIKFVICQNQMSKKCEDSRERSQKVVKDI